jgi:7-keto-8-aminopelargonate synthetase-like enzyme
MLVRQDLVKYLRSTSPAHIYAIALSPPAVQQVIYALKVILGDDNSDWGLQKSSAIIACIDNCHIHPEHTKWVSGTMKLAQVLWEQQLL